MFDMRNMFCRGHGVVHDLLEQVCFAANLILVFFGY